MTKGILGRKVGMTQVFNKDGILVPVTVVEATPNVVLQVKTVESDGYEAVQLGYQDKREVLSNKPEKGHAEKAETTPKRFIREINGVELKDYKVGSEVTVDTFKEGDAVNVTGITRGHGYQGNIKRHHQSRGPETHGSRYHRIPGSMGSIINRVPKGKKLPGHMGVKKVTIENLVIEKVVADKNVLLVKGNVPGAKNSLIVVKSASKATK
ncbi:MAG: 50S ribosomal protein L3 [Lactobacillus sp.]|nr:50S ribosomal protein L3 [Lactobacillus sp.]MDN6052901.1 50S ribosomal protein L3 [Lactobacillus sp.]